MTYSLAKLAELVGAEVVGDGELIISRVATLESATVGQIAFLANSKYRKHLDATKASAVILAEADLPFCKGAALVMKNPYLGFAKIAQLLDTTPAPADSLHPTAIIAPDAVLGEGVAIGPYSVIESGVVLEAGVKIGPHCFIGKGSRIGQGSTLWSNVAIYHGVSLGSHCKVHANAVIGSDGFGYANDRGKWEAIPQTGGVRIGNRVDIGAGTTIDRGALEDTVIEDNVIIDNQVQIAHNVVIGTGTAVAGTTVFAGSVTVGKYCIIGGACAIAGHLSIADGTTITGMSMVTKAITEPGVYSSGTPATPNREWRKSAARFRQLDEMHKRLKSLEEKLAAKEQSGQ
ncbi:UDP-3-O-(3-hydroxymyristoyl)glucosamine N-acyltransferase [Gallaecimonas xiamenensis]|uniref:UDP-3-O-(3-hydroxymyristoyl)glucosamine N-acyltransferase n=1 Tax=Gallaecimonas xiamenensis 3-C-1 TaxID=745411 RepID=K2J301_9GAMM|nr:UDP-3-O-(3-hydroxymyristoyl)glucosamine N-acyltransferase [Gallaecimonas xiamenensis]EKE69212.1 UDP-3-O-[3-hydroxymyristoyl] glucosamine N-acyltransferase [Gallaecimonas xiamenensis 3-C-1]